MWRAPLDGHRRVRFKKAPGHSHFDMCAHCYRLRWGRLWASVLGLDVNRAHEKELRVHPKLFETLQRPYFSTP